MTRFFTPDEANALLPQVRPLVEAMVRAQAKLVVAEAARQKALHAVAGNGGGFDPQELEDTREAVETLAAQVARVVAALGELGVEVKDPSRGLVDFPWQRDDGVALLCWELGEDRIAFWHGLEDGYAGRQPLD